MQYRRADLARTADEPILLGARGGGGWPAPSSSSPELLDGLRVLCVDSQTECARTAEILGAAGASVTEAASVGEALAAFVGPDIPDVLIVGVSPSGDAVELMRRVRALAPEMGGATPAIGLADRLADADLLRAVSAGLQICVRKPVTPDELVRLVAKLRLQAQRLREHRKRILGYRETPVEPEAARELEIETPIAPVGGFRENLVLRWASHAGDAALPLCDIFKVRARQELSVEGGDVVYFPVEAALSVSVVTSGGGSLAVALVGGDGALHQGVGLDGGYRVIAETGGTVYRLRHAHLDLASENARMLRAAVGLQSQFLFAQAARTAVCVARHSSLERLSGWLLALADLSPDGRLSVTQRAVGRAVAMRRQGVNERIAVLVKQGAVTVGRGKLVVLDRQKLLAATCECYAATRAAKASLWAHLGAR